MKLFARDRPPAVVLSALAPGERVVSWATTVEGDAVVATPRGLWWPGESGAYRLIGWQYVSKAGWHDGVFSVVEGDVVEGVIIDRPAVAVSLAVPRDLPPVVRKRVEANLVANELVSVHGGAVRFVRRRIPGAGRREWWARLEPGTPAAPDVLGAVRARLARLRES